MNFKKLSMASIGLAAFLFSCSCGKAEFSRDMMQGEIQNNFNVQSLQEKYPGMKVKINGTYFGATYDNSTYTLKDDCVYGGKTQEDPCHIKFGGDEDPMIPVLDIPFFNDLPTSAKFYKVGDGYSFSATEGDNSAEATFDKYFVCTSMKTKGNDMPPSDVTFTFTK